MTRNERLGIAMKAIRVLPLQLRQRGTYHCATALQPARWTWEAQGFLVSMVEGFLMSPLESELSSLLDIWPLKKRKVLSVSWCVDRPWVPLRMVCFCEGEWIRVFDLDAMPT